MVRRLIIVALIVVVAAVAAFLLLANNTEESGAVMLSGNIEVTDAALSFKIPGHLSERLVDEGEPVAAGQLVARLNPADQELAVAQAEANVALAEAVLSELQAGSRPQEISQTAAQVQRARAGLSELESGSRGQEIAAAEAEVKRAQALADQAAVQLELARADFRRSAQLFEQGVVPRQQYDAAETARDAALRSLESALAAASQAGERLSLVREGPRQETIEQARAALRQAEALHSLAVAGPRAETIEQAAAQVKIAREILRQAQQQLAYTELTAPFAGTVLSKAAEPGEYLNPGSPVLTIGNLQTVWLRAYINERDLGRAILGQRVEVSSDTYPDKVYEGRISFISSEAEFTPKAV
ncbi:MAG TPA: HlyD family efflux transporter periplasmic adaptor subunit, partial [Firmicutes bacterium]|nr:HlyD family efflux transporter periplasmic adaptor subunit [Bacillota bacterium]